MKVIKIHRCKVGSTTIIARECPTIWVISTTNKDNPSVSRRCNVRYKKKDYRTIKGLAAHIVGDEVGVYEYVNSLGATMRVNCTYKEYLFLKLNYGINGLTEHEYELYKSL